MLIDRYLYFTFTGLRAKYNAVQTVLEKFSQKDTKYTVLEQTYNFDLYAKAPQKGSAHPLKAYFFNFNDFLIMASNYMDGWETMAKYISTELNIESFSFRISDASNSEAMNSMRHVKNDKIDRIVYAMKDPKWVFYQEGPPLNFENTTYYKRRIIKDRINREILISYCKDLGIDTEDPGFWNASKSLFIERKY